MKYRDEKQDSSLPDEVYHALGDVHTSLVRLQDAIFVRTQRWPHLKVEMCASSFDGMHRLLEEYKKMKPYDAPHNTTLKLVMSAFPGEIEFVRGTR